MGLFDAISSGINGGIANAISLYNVNQQERINQQNIDNQWEMWRATNEYNSPVAQMQRYKEAGLNPNLIYGQSNTTSPVDVGKSVAPKMEFSPMFQGFGNVMQDYFTMLSLKEDARTKQLNNEILADTLNERKNSYELGNRKVESEIAKNESDVSLNSSQQDLIKSQIERNGFLNTLSSLEASIKSFEIEDFDRIRKIRSNDLEKSNLSVESSKLSNTNMSLRNDLLEANIKVAQFSIYLDYMEYTLKSAQTEEALSRIGLNNVEKQKKLQEIENLKKQIDLIGSQIDLNNSTIFTNKVRRQQMRSSIGTDWMRTIFGNGGILKGGLSTFRMFKTLLK